MNSQDLPGSDLLSEIGALDYNEELLASPRKIPLNPFLRNESQKDNDMPMLSPFARALFYTGEDTRNHQYIRDGLRTTYIATEEPCGLSRPDSERATHYIDKHYGDRKFSLRFDAEACLIWAGDHEDPDYKPLFSLLDIVEDLRRLERIDTQSLLATARSRAEEIFDDQSRNKTIAYVVDDGEFVCTIEHRLVSVNGINLSACPVICDSVDEVDIRSTAQGFTAPESRWSSFSWIDLLTGADKELVGLSAIQTESDGISSEDNRWMLLTANELDESYQCSGLITSPRNKPDKLSILFGAGGEWDPEYGLDNPAQTSGLDEYPTSTPPTYDLELRDGEDLTEEEQAYIDAIAMLVNSL